ncbi:Metallo-dependent phosphatase-like protein [Aspergillus tamarii]|uniref:Metallo-dependent phosphatase-like protein n=1 Tax=Aspergillus tamarii TaxID=41984 RepID=A0A5N6UW39_ASPTM|nr:Metallo-dependent phosphatase-like protein [Aspergillus tamarii]
MITNILDRLDFRVFHNKWTADLRQIALSPLTIFVWTTYTILNFVRWNLMRSKQWPRIRVVCLADTHSQRCDVPDGDLLIHAGDLSLHGSAAEIQETVNWLKSLPHSYKVVISGNSDRFFDVTSRLAEDKLPTTPLADSASNGAAQLRRGIPIDWGDIHHLQRASVCLPIRDTSGVMREIRVYGSPQIPVCGGPDNAFQYPVDQNPWAESIPASTDILVTHTPARFHRDWYHGSPEGCPFLLDELWKVRPLLHVFGHVHTSHGVERVQWDSAQWWLEKYYRDASDSAQNPVLFALPGFFHLVLWLDAIMILLSGVIALVRDLASLRRREERSTLMVNAACMSEDGERLVNEPIVVYI